MNNPHNVNNVNNMDAIALLIGNNFINHYSKEKYEYLFKCSSVHIAEKDEYILKEGQNADYLYFLLDGIVGIFLHSSDQEGILLHMLKAPAVFGEMEFVLEIPYILDMKAFERCTYLKMSRETAKKIFLTDSSALYELILDMSKRMCIFSYQQKSLAFESMEERLAALFFSFARFYGKETPQGRFEIRYRFTVQTLSKCLGVTTRSVDRVLEKWRMEHFCLREDSIFIFENHVAIEKRLNKYRRELLTNLEKKPRLNFPL